MPSARPGRYLAVLICLLSLPLAAAAGSVRFAAGSSPEPYFSVALEDQRVPGGRAGLGLSGPAPLRLDMSLRRTTGLGVLGNIVLDVDGSISTDGGVTAALSGRAAAGPLAFRLNADAASSLAARTGGSAPTRWSVGAGVTWRVERNLLLLVDPVVGRSPEGGLAFVLPVEVQLPRSVGRHDLRLRVEGGFAGPGAAGPYAAAGAGLRIDRGRAPAWEAWLLFGGRGRRVSPGLSLQLREDAGRHTARAALLLEPWRTGTGLFDLQLGWTVRGEKQEAELNVRLLVPPGSVEAEAAVKIPVPGD